MRNVVITGADGFVGSNTVEYFLEKNINVLAIDIFDTPRRLSSHKNLKYLKLDISNIDSLPEIINRTFDTFIHFAWEGSAGSLRSDYNIQIKNALNAVKSMKTAKKIGCTRFVCAGSIMEYEVEATIHAQGNHPSAVYIYGLGKFLAHGLCKLLSTEIGIDLIWPQITNTYGVGELSPRFVNTTLRKMIKGESLQFTSAAQNYDFIYISDVAKAFYLIAENGKANCSYIVGSGQAKPLKDFILEMQQACAPQSELHFGDIPFSGTNIPIGIFNNDALKVDCGFVPSVSFSAGTKLTMEWLKENDSEI